MNKIIKQIFFSLLFVSLLGSCNDEPDYYTLETPPDQMNIKASAEKVTLLETDKLKEAITFTWDKAANRGEGTKLIYYFRMYHAEANDLQSELIKLDEDTYSISWNVRELNNILHAWRIEPGEEVSIVAEVLATVEGGSEYLKPEISNIRFTAVGYDPSNKLYLTIENRGQIQYLVMNMIEEEVYNWQGELDLCDFWFVRNTDKGVPTYMKGNNENTVVFSESGAGEYWSTQTYGLYDITVDLTDMSLTMDVTPIDRLYLTIVDLAGDEQNIPMTVIGDNVYTWEGLLEECDFWFVRNMTTGLPAYMKGDEENTLEYSDDGNGKHWNVEKYGNCKIRVDLNEMTLEMELTPINRLFLVATKNGENTVYSLSEDEPESDFYYWHDNYFEAGTQFRFVRNPKALWPAYVKSSEDKKMELKEEGSEMFTFTESSRYMILVDMNELSLVFVDVYYVPATGVLGVVGDAIVGTDWNAGDALRNSPLTAKDFRNQPHIWSYTGNFQCVSGADNQFKFVGDDGWGHSIFSVTEDANPFDPNQQGARLENVGDTKWKLPDGTPNGVYTLELNFQTFSINLVRQD